MNYKLLLSAVLLGLSTQINAAVCRNATLGQVNTINFNLTDTISSANNIVGGSHTLNRAQNIGVYAICPQNSSTDGATYRSYVTDLPVMLNSGGFKYLQLNEYLLGAMSIVDGTGANGFYPPATYVRMGIHGNVNAGLPFEVEDNSLVFRLRVLKPFIDFVLIPERTMFTVYVTSNATSPLSTPVYRYTYSGSIQVPQNCIINAGQDITINFGKIPALAFSQAGAGNKAIGINPETRTIDIRCSNINSTAALTLRLEAERTNGEIMQSNNTDIGFKIADSNGNILTPNNSNSTIPFRLVDTLATVKIQAWPVSSTGATPQLGPFNANGYIRIDFD